MSHYQLIGDKKYKEFQEEKIKWNSVLECISEGIIIIEDEKIIYLNPSVKNLLNIPKQDENNKIVESLSNLFLDKRCFTGYTSF